MYVHAIYTYLLAKFFFFLVHIHTYMHTYTHRSEQNTPIQPKSPAREIRTRVPRVKQIDIVRENEDSFSQSESVSDLNSVYTDASGSFYSNNHNHLLGNDKNRKKNKKKKKRKSSRGGSSMGSVISSHSSNDGSSSVSEQVDLGLIAREFVTIMQGGMKLLAATSIGSTRIVTVITDGVNLTWGIPKSKPVMSVALSTISSVRMGMPPKLLKSFLASDVERSFNLVLKGDSKAATFIAPTPLERDALVHGFQSLLATLNNPDNISETLSKCDDDDDDDDTSMLENLTVVASSVVSSSIASETSSTSGRGSNSSQNRAYTPPPLSGPPKPEPQEKKGFKDNENNNDNNDDNDYNDSNGGNDNGDAYTEGSNFVDYNDDIGIGVDIPGKSVPLNP